MAARAVAVLLVAFASAAAAATVWGVTAGLNKGGELGGLGVIAAIAIGAAGLPATLGALALARLYWKSTRWKLLAGLSGTLAVLAVVLFLAPVGNLPERYGWLAGAAPFAIHAVHAMVARR